MLGLRSSAEVAPELVYFIINYIESGFFNHKVIDPRHILEYKPTKGSGGRERQPFKSQNMSSGLNSHV